jgi:hypothetical protein
MDLMPVSEPARQFVESAVMGLIPVGVQPIRNKGDLEAAPRVRTHDETNLTTAMQSKQP